MAEAYDIQLDPENHQYTVNGLKMPSVSAVMRALNSYDGVPEDVLQRAAIRGTHVHTAIEYMIQGRLNWETLDDELRPYVAAAQKFLQDTGSVIESHETMFYHPSLMYCGQIDAVIHVRDRRRSNRYVIDWKTTAQLMPSVGVQTAAYQRGFRAATGKPALRGAVLLKSDGSYKFSKQNDREDWQNFKAALRLYNWRHRK